MGRGLSVARAASRPPAVEIVTIPREPVSGHRAPWNFRRTVLLQVSPISHRRWRIAAIGCALAAAALLAGCGKKQEAQAVVGQVIAHVGPDDVTQNELDNELRLAGIPADKRTDAIVKAALARVIERKYLVQQAVAGKLDREPTVHLDIMRAREQILAGGFVQRDLSSKMSTISKNEIDSYIQAHPRQFDQRELFQIEQIAFTPPKNMEALTAATKDAKSLDQVEAQLNQFNIKFSRGTATLDSATIPAEMLKALDARKPDDVFFIRARGSGSYFKVTSVDQKPLTGDDATEFAKREVRAQIAQKSAEEISQAALANAKYEGDYARIMATPTAAPAAGGAAPAASPGGEAPSGSAQETEKPAGETGKEQPKN
jgi:EpsD family peptidyl-prolyl cis-trans isomerase